MDGHKADERGRAQVGGRFHDGLNNSWKAIGCIQFMYIIKDNHKIIGRTV